MKNPFTLVTPPGITAKRAMEKEADAAFAKIMLASEAPKTTIVGDLVQKMDRTYRAYTERADRLTASIADQQEQLRQTRVTIAAIEAAMTTLADEVVLTPDERTAAKAAADAHFDELMSRSVMDMLLDPTPVDAKSQTELPGSRSPTFGDALAYSRGIDR